MLFDDFAISIDVEDSINLLRRSNTATRREFESTDEKVIWDRLYFGKQIVIVKFDCCQNAGLYWRKKARISKDAG